MGTQTKQNVLIKKRKGINTSDFVDPASPLDVACLIHSDGYDWSYVEKLHSMVTRHISKPVNFHVYTEADRPVPAPYIKHNLTDWGIAGPKKSWWYKMQLFNSDLFRGPLLYFDLDTVITGNIDWMWKLNLRHFWAARDFKYLWRPHWPGINSSVMWWNTAQFDHVWREVESRDLNTVIKRYHGDQDLINEIIPMAHRRFFNEKWVKSWRWQCLDGGFDFSRRQYAHPNTGTKIDSETSVLVFHGNPKPDSVKDSLILQHWK